MSDTVTNILIGVVLFLFLLLSIFIKGRRMLKTPLGRVASILSEIKYNEQMVENFSFHHDMKRFKTRAWMKNKNKIDFLPQELRMPLSQAFEMSEEFNERIDAAKKFRSDSYMAGIDVSKLKAPLAKVKEPLLEWLQVNMNNPEYMPKRRGLFG